MDAAGVAIWFLLSAFVGWVVMDLRYTWLKRMTPPPRVIELPQRDRAAIGRGGVYYGGPTPEGTPPISALFTHPQPSAVLSTSGILTANEQRTMVHAWGGDLVRADVSGRPVVLHDNWRMDPFAYEEVGRHR